jgi:hypothetical protein
MTGIRGQLKYLILRADYGWSGVSRLNFQADYGCLALKEPFLSFEMSLLLKAFLALKSQADYGRYRLTLDSITVVENVASTLYIVSTKTSLVSVRGPL